MSFPVADSYTVASGQPVNAGRLAVVAPAFESTYERASFNPALSAIVPGAGVDGSLLITMNILRENSETNGDGWMCAGVDVVGMTGQRPTFRWLQAARHHWASAWPANKQPMYSLDDGYTWAYTGAAQVRDVGNDWIQFRPTAAFTQNKIRIADGRQMAVHQHGERIAALAAAYSFVEPAPTAAAFVPTAAVSSYAAQAFIGNQYSAGTDTLGRVVPMTPLYCCQINDTSVMPVSGPKKVWLMNGGTHGGEDIGDFTLWYALYWLCGNLPEAIELRRNFRIIFYPITSAQARAAGNPRGSCNGPPNDGNRHMNDNTLQSNNFLKAATPLDFAGLPLMIFMDFHGFYNGGFECTAGTNTIDNNFRLKLQTLAGFTVNDYGNVPVNFKSGWYHTPASDGFAGARLSVTVEQGDPTPLAESQLVIFGESMMKAVHQMLLEGVFA